MGRGFRRMTLVAACALVPALALSAWRADGARADERPAPPAFSMPSTGDPQDAEAGAIPLTLKLAPVMPASSGLETNLTGSEEKSGSTSAAPVLNPYRAQVLLRSLTVPGWGQATLGHKTAAIVFFTAEVAIWTTYTAFRVQEAMRRDSYERTANILAGIDLSKRDEEYRRIVGSYISSEEYNQLVVYRDAANLYYDDPVRYQQYIEDHVLRGQGTWQWQDEGSLLRYQGQRKDAQRAAQRANTALAAAIINRLLSAVHAARASAQAAPSSAWRLEVVPTDDGDASALRLGVRRQF